jgi:hypothetical protein
MNFISNKKINQVTDQTLVVGMDIAKKKSIMPALWMSEGGC